MTPQARAAAAIDLLDAVLAGAPAEKVLTSWARKSRFAGSRDRAAVRDIVFDCLRCRRSFAARGGAESGRGLVLGMVLAQGGDPDEVFSGQGYGPAPLSDAERATMAPDAPLAPEVAANLPNWVFDLVKADGGADAALALGQGLSQRAPVDLRVNIAKGTVAEAVVRLAAEEIAVTPVEGVATALRVTENARRVAQSAPYRDGLVEIQDAASQAVVAALPLQPDMHILDLCAGGGGKSLAMAARVPSARLDAWDISAERLAPLAERARRAGAQVTLLDARPRVARYDLVLVDAPCSGSGAWRRSPEAKWRLTESRLSALRDMQAEVMQAGWRLFKPGGVLAYATCSVLAPENGVQVAAFQAGHPEARLIDTRDFGLGAPGDGFYLAVLGRMA